MTYHCTCPVCGVAHDVAADFMSSPRTIIATNGREGLSHTCGRHTATELQAARWSSKEA